MINGVTAIDSTSVQVDWSIPTNPNGILTVYAIAYNIEGGVSMTVNVRYNGQLVIYMCTYIVDIHMYNDSCPLVTILQHYWTISSSTGHSNYYCY